MTSGSVLAIDLGTSGVKAAVVTPDGALHGTGTCPIPMLTGADGAAEQDPDAVWRAVVTAARDAVARTGTIEPPIRAVSCCSQYSSVVPVDDAGRAVANMVTWLDQRGDTTRLRGLAGRRVAPAPLDLLRWVRIHGVPPLDSGIDSLSHMRWIRFARPGVYARTAVFLEPVDYVALRLTGTAAATQCSAFMMLLTDNRVRDDAPYSSALVRRALVDRDKLPRLVPLAEPVGTVLPEVAAELGLLPEVVVYPGVNDTQAGAVGSGAFRGSAAGLSIGTTTVIVTDVDFKKTDIRNSIVTMPSPIPGDYLVMAEGGIGGKAIDHFLERLVFGVDGFGEHTLEDRFGVLSRVLARVPPGSGGVVFLPWLAGSTTPQEDRHVRGGFLNISLDTTREHLARSVLEGVAFNLRWIQDAVERFSRRPVTELRFHGGGALSPEWSQILADILDRPVHRLQDPEFAPCRGAGFLGLVRSGQLAYDDIPGLIRIAGTHEPDARVREGYDEMFGQFVTAFRRNRKIFRALNRDGRVVME
jgi:xylulokinase